MAASGCYRQCLHNAHIVQVVILIACALSIAYGGKLAFDASSDSLVAEGDPELAYYRDIVTRFNEPESLFLTFSPQTGDLFSKPQLDRLAELQARLEALPGVSGVTSLLDVPLLRSPPLSIAELKEGYNTLRSGADLELAREELVNSPLFRELLVSGDGDTTAMQIRLAPNAALSDARRELDALRQAEPRDKAAVDAAQAEYDAQKAAHQQAHDVLIASVRELRNQYGADASLHLGGVPMVAADIIDFVRRDMVLLTLAVLVLIGAALYFFFRRWRWVVIPIGTVSVTLLIMVGILGFLGKPVTAISSTFIPLLTITTISFTIHLIVRYRELCIKGFSDNHVALVYEAMRSKLAPCIYTGLTTSVAFASLMTSGIRPVIEFGWIMVLGVVVGFFVTYSFFAGILVTFPYSKKPKPTGESNGLTMWFSRLALGQPGLIIGLSVVLGIAGVIGLGKLDVNNRFVDYFKSGSEIHDGMAFIDKQLGGTIPFDVIIDFEPWEPQPAFDEDDDFASDDAEPDAFPERYWFTPARVATAASLEGWLSDRPEIGKVLSVSTLERLARTFNDGEPLNYVEMTSVLALVPEEVRASLISPYASPQTGEIRISGRLRETGPVYSKDALFEDIRNFAIEELEIAPERVHVTGMGVLFNDMLSQLLNSQRSTILFVLGATLLTFALLLRSVALAVIGIIPTLLAAIVVLAFMGFGGIPLNIMTITTAAIVIGIGVDDAIHYLHRFRDELRECNDTAAAVHNSHGSIGNALYFTTVTVVVGFSVLMLSSFVPTIYFGVLTALAMVLALLANLLLLPSLLLKLYR